MTGYDTKQNDTLNNMSRKRRKTMAEERRPDNMTRITTRELADEFIEKQISDLRDQIALD